MLPDHHYEFTKDSIDTYLKALGKEYRRLIGKKMPAELILVGGASVLINYGFRNMTTDIDAMITAASGMKDAIGRVADEFDLPAGWMNDDFRRTASWTPGLAEHSVYYRTYSNVLSVRTVAAEYLIAMKLRSGRQYKNDLSDVLGILAEHQKQGKPIKMKRIREAVSDLYGDWSVLPDSSRAFIDNVMSNGNFEDLYEQTARGEQQTKDLLIQFEEDYPDVLKEKNVNNIAENLQRKTNRASVLAELRKKKSV